MIALTWGEGRERRGGERRKGGREGGREGSGGREGGREGSGEEGERGRREGE